MCVYNFDTRTHIYECCRVLQSVAECCSVLQSVAVWCSMLRVLQCAASSGSQISTYVYMYTCVDI